MSTCGMCDRKVEEGQKFCEEHKLQAAQKMFNMGIVVQSKPNVAGTAISGHASAQRGQRGQHSHQERNRD